MKESRLVRIASEVVAAAQRELPPDVRKAARAVPVRLEPSPDAAILAEGFEPDLLGLFTGSPVGTELSGGALEPPRIFLYTANLWDFAEEDVEAYREEVRLTYLHELGHYLGWDEDQVAELQRRIPAADVTTIETGHNVQEEDPVGLAQLLEGLLRD